MQPILVTLELGGGVRPIGGYGVALAIAILLGGALLVRAAHRARLDVGATVASLGGCVLGGFVGGYLMSVLVTGLSSGDFGLAFESGGLVFYGGLIGGVLGLVTMARAMGLPVARLLDCCPTPLALAHSIGRIGCLLGGCCYGAATEHPFGIVFTDPLAPAAIEAVARHPVQLYESAALLLLALLFALPFATRRAGDRLALYLGAYGVVRLATESFRADPERGQLWGLLSTSQALSLVSVMGCLIWLRGGFVSAGRTGYTGHVSQRPSRSILLLLVLCVAMAMLATPSFLGASEPASRAQTHGALRVPMDAGVFHMGSDGDAVEAAVALCATDPLLSDACRASLFAHELPRHRVRLRPYAIDRTEVSNAAYRRCVSANACTPSRAEAGDVRLGQPRQPVTGVSHRQALAYCAFAGGHLPTEAQWERAARASSPRAFPWGKHWNPSLANFGTADGKPDPADGYRYAAPVDAYSDGRSIHGLLNMAGNVWEWTADRYGADYYDGSPTVDPTGPATGDAYVIRGGSWRSPPHTLRASQRRKLAPDEARPDVGIRCAYDR